MEKQDQLHYMYILFSITYFNGEAAAELANDKHCLCLQISCINHCINSRKQVLLALSCPKNVLWVCSREVFPEFSII